MQLTLTGIGGILKARVTDFRVDEISTNVSLDSKRSIYCCKNHSY